MRLIGGEQFCTQMIPAQIHAREKSPPRGGPFVDAFAIGIRPSVTP
jgi:hypothetical protein